MKLEIILQVGGEGGSISLYGFKMSEGSWCYIREMNESALYNLIEDEDLQLDLIRSSDIIDNWDLAIRSIDAFPWPLLHPKKVHPDFSIRIWERLMMLSERFADFRTDSWSRVCFQDHPLYKLVSWMKESNNTVVLTGAGSSVDSGISDFRSRDGWWKKLDPSKVASLEAVENNYLLFHEFYRIRLEHLAVCKPHIGHFILSQWEVNGWIHSIATQNVDGLHQQAGNKKVRELHGTIRTIRCHICGNEATLQKFMEHETCGVCQGILRPNVVLFGEQLPQQAWQTTLEEIKKAELILVIGTSLQVYPVNQLPWMTEGKLAMINLEDTNDDNKFDIMIRGKAKDVLCDLDKILKFNL